MSCRKDFELDSLTGPAVSKDRSPLHEFFVTMTACRRFKLSATPSEASAFSIVTCFGVTPESSSLSPHNSRRFSLLTSRLLDFIDLHSG